MYPFAQKLLSNWYCYYSKFTKEEPEHRGFTACPKPHSWQVAAQDLNNENLKGPCLPFLFYAV